jgi:pyruvate/2-oxoglutarate dehydrogenase complex dihydrolipoamide dehydrogenase (E3) component
MVPTYDLVIVGTGTAAMGVAMRVRAAGWRVAVIDFRPFGGTCALRACDPKKVLVSGAETVDLVYRMRGHGVTGNCSINWPELMAFKRTFTDPVQEENRQKYAIYHSSRKVVTSQLAKITCPRSRLYRNLDPWRRTSYWSDFQDIINRDAKPGPSAGQKMCGVSQS